jgi:hypothetical protein
MMGLTLAPWKFFLSGLLWKEITIDTEVQMIVFFHLIKGRPRTSIGVKCQISLQNYVKSLCPYYHDVHETFMDRASSFAEFTNERNFEEDSLGSDVETGTKTDTTDTNDTVNSSRSAATGNPTAVRISPKTTGGRAIDVDFTPKQSNCLSLVSASAATQKML